jgi:hypothetical protein
MYCSKCGSKNSDDAIFCSSCGSNLKTVDAKLDENAQNVEVKIKKKNSLVTIGHILGILLLFQSASYIFRGIYMISGIALFIAAFLLIPTQKKSENNFYFKFGKRTRITLVFILLIFATIGASAEVAVEKANTDRIYTLSTEQMVLSNNDMSDDWYGSVTTEGSSSKSSFTSTSGLLPQTITCTVTKYSTTSEASSYYQTIYQQYKDEHIDAKYDSFSLGQEAFSAEHNSGYQDTTVFRKGNVVVIVEQDLGHSTQKYAKKVYNKIK